MMAFKDVTCHAADGPRLKWSGRTNQGASSGPAGQCKVATVGPSLPQSVPLCHRWSPTTIRVHIAPGSIIF